MEYFLREQQRLTESVSSTKRYLYSHIDWSLRCIGILGARGTGKTTLMLQHIKERYGSDDRALYVSVDSPYFQARSLLEFAEEFYSLGGVALFLDEIHKYPDWAVHIKSIYDSLPGLKIIFSGSSLLQIAKQKADLSRRAIIYNLHGLSFREFINFSVQKDYPAYPLETLLEKHQEIAGSICRDMKILRHFRDYIQHGYYPFFLEGEAYYRPRVREVINHILEVDLPYVHKIEPRQISKIKKLIYLLAVSVPFTPNIAKLAEATEISRPTLYEYLERLQDAKLLNLVRSKGRGYEILTKPDRIYLENTNLMHAVTDQANTGSMRELFFVNQIKNSSLIHTELINKTLELSDKGDFIVNSYFTFEIGGKGKGFRQIDGVEKSFVAADEIETGFKNKIPLWIFGFLY